MTSAYWHQMANAIWTPDDESQYQDGRSSGSRSSRSSSKGTTRGTTRRPAATSSSGARSKPGEKITSRGR
jgi:hypothetical protein